MPTSDATRLELVAQIWKAPEDRMRLAVFADWALEHGEATRGEYMHLALLESPTPAQQKRRDALLEQYRGEWLGAARPHVYSWRDSATSPGFVARLLCSLDDLANHREVICALGPRLLIKTHTINTKKQRALLESLPLGTLYGMSFSRPGQDWRQNLDRLFPNLVGLRHLELSVLDVKFDAKTILATLDAIPTIDELSLFFNGPSDARIEGLLASASTARLRKLTIKPPENPDLKQRLEAAFSARALGYAEFPAVDAGGPI